MRAQKNPRRPAGHAGASDWGALYGHSSPVDFGIELRHPDRLGEQRASCPQCAKGPRDDALAAKVGPDGVVWLCHRCGWKGSTAGQSFDPVPRRVDTASIPQEQEHDRARERLRRLWAESKPLDLRRHELARRYLSSRGLGAIVADPPAGLRFHAELTYFDGPTRQALGRYPAILAAVRAPDGRVMTLHRTYLATDGAGKAPVASPRKLCPAWRQNGLRGAAVRLYAATERLALAEGIETAIAVRVASGWPVWSCVSAHGLATVELPDAVRSVLIAADFDLAGLGGAEALARRLLAEGRCVRVAVPDEPGRDFNDMLQVTA